MPVCPHRFALLALAVSLAIAAPAAGATITVDGTTCTLANAILSANADADTNGCTGSGGYGADVITLDADVTLTAPDTTNSTSIGGAYAGLPEISGNLTIQAGAGRVIQRDPAYGCFQNDANSFRLLETSLAGTKTLTLIGLELRHGCVAPGSGSNATAAAGAVFPTDDTTLTVTDCVFEDNQVWGSGLGSASLGGAVYVNGPSVGSSATFTNTRFIGNHATGRADNSTTGIAQGGALNVGDQSSVSLSGCLFDGNEAKGGANGLDSPAYGGAIAFGGVSSELTSIASCTFRDNHATARFFNGFGSDAHGGAIGFVGSAGQIGSLSGSIFEGNVAEGGAGSTGKPAGLGGGGAISCPSPCSLLAATDLLFRGNQALGGNASVGGLGGNAQGGAIEVDLLGTTDSLTFVDNEARGGFSADGGDAAGGAIYTYIPVFTNPARNLTASGNLAQGGDSDSSGTGGDATGGAFHIHGTNVTLQSTTLAGNRAVSGAGSGGNGLAQGGGLFITESNPTIAYLLAAGNTASQGGGAPTASDCSTDSSLVTGGANVVQDADSCAGYFTGPTDQLGVDPLVAPLGDYGCIAQLPDGSCLPTMALDLTSTAINRGACTGLGVRDARGFAREVGGSYGVGTGNCDSGAFETQNITFVDANAGGANNGTSWTDAYSSLRDALDAHNPPSPRPLGAVGDERDEIWIAEGVYRPDVGTGAVSDDPTETFTVGFDTILYGGFAGGATSLADRNPVAHPTVLSGDIGENDTVDADGVTATYSDIVGTNTRHLMTLPNTPDASTILDGLVLTGAKAAGSTTADKSGSDLVCPAGGAVTLRNLRVVGNWMGSRATIFGCDVEASDASFENNYSNDVGAIMAGGNSRFVRTRFSGNQAAIQAALFYLGGTRLRLLDSVVTGNKSISGQGAIRLQGGELELTNTVLSGNSAGLAAVIFLTATASATLTNVTIAGNDGNGGKGAIDLESTGHLAIRNSILWNNRTDSTPGSLGASISDTGNGTIEIRNSILQGSGGSGGWIPSWTDGGGNLDTDPLFVTDVDPVTAPTTAGDLRLRLASPAIDAGDDAVVTTTTDLDGDSRITGSAVDMGPWERPGELFSDGFETGNDCLWSTQVGGGCGT